MHVCGRSKGDREIRMGVHLTLSYCDTFRNSLPCLSSFYVVLQGRCVTWRVSGSAVLTKGVLLHWIPTVPAILIILFILIINFLHF